MSVSTVLGTTGDFFRAHGTFVLRMSTGDSLLSKSCRDNCSYYCDITAILINYRDSIAAVSQKLDMFYALVVFVVSCAKQCFSYGTSQN